MVKNLTFTIILLYHNEMQALVVIVRCLLLLIYWYNQSFISSPPAFFSCCSIINACGCACAGVHLVQIMCKCRRMSHSPLLYVIYSHEQVITHLYREGKARTYVLRHKYLWFPLRCTLKPNLTNEINNAFRKFQADAIQKISWSLSCLKIAHV